MAKIKNRIANKRMQKKAEAQDAAFRDLKAEMQQLMDTEDYVAAMDVMAEIAANKKIDADVMYWGAVCYFRTGDYERAAKWVNNVLTYDSSSLRARSLLAAICISEGRREDGIRIAGFVLSNAGAGLAEQDREFLQEVLAPVRYGSADVLAQYPQVREFLAETSDIQSALDVAAGMPEVADRQPEKEQAEADAAKPSAVEALAKLRRMLEKSRAAGQEQVQPAEEVPQESFALTDEQASKVPAVEEQENAEAADGNIAETGFDVDSTVEKVLAKEISLCEKVKLLNIFAGACYQEDDFQSAFDLLSAALQLDGCDAATLRNMAYVCLSAGEKEQALAYAAKLPMADFGLLYALKHN